MNFRTPPGDQSLSEVNSSVETRGKTGFFRKLWAFLGPAYLVSVGYMDPGNWATDIAGGSGFGYSLIWVLLMSNLIALLLQSFSARLGIVRRMDLAQASRSLFPGWINGYLYVLAEVAIAATDLAEVLGMAIGIKLLTGLPIFYGVLLSVLDTFILLFLIQYGIRKMEAFIISLVSIVGISFFIEMLIAKPAVGEVLHGFIPSIPDGEALYIAIGIIGATVMPHNLYLHSALVQSRKFNRNDSQIRKALRFNFIDSAIALNLAFFVNSAILILAATAFYKNGLFSIAEIEDAHQMLAPMLGSNLSPLVFAIALIAAGQSSTITGTLAGQIVMEGYLRIRLQPWVRRILTRLIAIIPSLLVIHFMGEESTGKMLILSQVILSLQLGFAIVPLLHAVSDKEAMGVFVIRTHWKILGWLSAAVIVSLNLKMVYEIAFDPELAGWARWLLIPLVLFSLVVLLFITLKPFIKGFARAGNESLHGSVPSWSGIESRKMQRVAVAVDFSKSDESAIRQSLKELAGSGTLYLIHVTETAGSLVLGKETAEHESDSDQAYLKDYQMRLSGRGIEVQTILGFGRPADELVRIVGELNPDVLVLATHGHKAFKDILLGTTIDKVRHHVKVPVIIVSR